MSYHFSAYMYRLRAIQRWSLMRSTSSENVAEHSFHVAILAHLLCEIGNQVYDKQLNADRAATLALFHDATEVFTGDIPTPVKHHNPKLLSSFREMEGIAAERLISMIPTELKHIYAPILHPEPEQDVDYEIRTYVKAADSLDAYLKCAWELASGNREFAAAKLQLQLKLESLNMPEIRYFQEKFVPGFELTLDELSGDQPEL
ncbi:5'-deoxynucleotidase [Paenibacillus shirakamiensis]|uniref:5'-deoxynucleotidase n=1 Tax=Paenibacillus shirakamiensis TaxID=1265935 RepID=A0ABS4JN09_9BACL|nr:5'-deoxynucleotidase [Paenibacillus shirakamiensis]MBP2002525.1 5'-deoxynucleotidase [Paenibacillus shirakamiensis]